MTKFQGSLPCLTHRTAELSPSKQNSRGISHWDFKVLELSNYWEMDRIFTFSYKPTISKDLWLAMCIRKDMTESRWLHNAQACNSNYFVCVSGFLHMYVIMAVGRVGWRNSIWYTVLRDITYVCS